MLVGDVDAEVGGELDRECRNSFVRVSNTEGLGMAVLGSASYSTMCIDGNSMAFPPIIRSQWNSTGWQLEMLRYVVSGDKLKLMMVAHWSCESRSFKSCGVSSA